MSDFAICYKLQKKIERSRKVTVDLSGNEADIILALRRMADPNMKGKAYIGAMLVTVDNRVKQFPLSICVTTYDHPAEKSALNLVLASTVGSTRPSDTIARPRHDLANVARGPLRMGLGRNSRVPLESARRACAEETR